MHDKHTADKHPVTTEHEQNLVEAQNVVNEYGHLLVRLDGTTLAYPASRLPYTVDTIKSAIHLLLWELRGQDRKIIDSLVQSYVYLAQFVSDSDAEIVQRGQQVMFSSDIDADELAYAEKAKAIITQVKLEMENLLEDLNAFL